LKCIKNLYVYNGICLKECKNGLYEYYNISKDKFECELCENNLKNCSNCVIDKNELKCLGCSDGCYSGSNDNLC
jgi:hypothetical protein